MKDKIYIFVDKRKWRRMLMSFLGKHIYNEFSSFRPCDYYLVAAHTLEESDTEKRQLEL